MELDDSTAVDVLRRVTQSRLIDAGGRGPSDAELRSMLSDAFNPPAQPGSVSEGELARTALNVLRQDPRYNVLIEELADPATMSYEPISLTIAVGAAAFMALRTRLRFKRDSTGKWSLDIDKEASSDKTLMALVESVMALPVG
jgi:hypothetical protein